MYRNLDRDRHPRYPRSRIYYEVLLGLLTHLVICLPAYFLLSLLLVAGYLCKVILVCVVACGLACFCSILLFSWVGVVFEDVEKLFLETAELFQSACYHVDERSESFVFQWSVL